MQSLRQQKRIGRSAETQLERHAKSPHLEAQQYVQGSPGNTFSRSESTSVEKESGDGSRPLGVPNDDNQVDFAGTSTPNIQCHGSSMTAHPIGESQNQIAHDQKASPLSPTLTGILVRMRTKQDRGEPGGQIFVVGWQGPNDPLKATNWSYGKRVCVVLQISLVGFVLTGASSIDSAVLPQAARSLHVSEVAESLATGLYLAGMGIGSLIAGPFSETFGRNAVYSVSMVIFMIWIMASGLAPKFGEQCVFRFLAGCAASTPLVCAGGSIADMFDSMEKTTAFPLYAISSFGGPIIGPVIGAWIGPSREISWRWSEWVMLIAAGITWIILLLFMPETYSPILLQWKAAHYRRITGDDRFRCEHEIVDATLLSRLKISMTRPFLMLTEPIILAMTLYITVAYIVLFTFLVGWPYLFQNTYGISQGLSNTIFIAMAIGVWCNFFLVPVIYHLTIKHFRREEKGNSNLRPEIRLLWGTLGSAVALPVSLFWLGWTNYSSISIWSAICAVALFGYSIMGIFMCVYMYIIDSYEIYSASALTFVSLVRYLAAGGMTVVGIPFYESVHTHFVLTILGCIATALCTVPYALWFFGPSIRARSRFAASIQK